MVNQVKVAVASDFLTAFFRIPRSQQAKVLDFVNKFRTDPSLPGINYEKIQGAKDSKLRSVRIDHAYRGIVLKPETCNVYVFLWVDHHDKAYEWAENKMYNIHPQTGSLQVINIEEVKRVRPERPDAVKPEKAPLFDGIHDRHLVRLGVPEMLLPLVRKLKTPDELDQNAERLPQEAYEALVFLADGFSLEEVFREMDKPEEPREINTDDYEKALNNLDSRRRFYVVEDDLEMAAILNAASSVNGKSIGNQSWQFKRDPPDSKNDVISRSRASRRPG